MKALSLWQPWASAMALGLKRNETRGWSTSYRGPLAIHAAKRWTRAEQVFLADAPSEFTCPEMREIYELPLGDIVGVCELYDCIGTDDALNEEDQLLSSREEFWGNYGVGRFAWLTRNMVRLPVPIPYCGAQGLFEITGQTETLLQFQLANLKFGMEVQS